MLLNVETKLSIPPGETKEQGVDFAEEAYLKSIRVVPENRFLEYDFAIYSTPQKKVREYFQEEVEDMLFDVVDIAFKSYTGRILIKVTNHSDHQTLDLEMVRFKGLRFDE